MNLRLPAALLLAVCIGMPAAAHSPASRSCKEVASREATRQTKECKPLAKKQRGKASYYARRFTGQKMADGTRFNPSSNVAASKTLPLGTKARVKNLKTGKSAVVEIRDRGPYVKGRIIDLTPKTAEQLGMKKDGVAPVEVQPLAGPPQG